MKTVEACARDLLIRYNTPRMAIEVATRRWADTPNPTTAAYWRDVVNEIKHQEDE